jgi:GDP-L-fucose synthase
VHVVNLEKAKYDQCTDPMCSHINVGVGVDVTIRELADIVKAVVGYEGKIAFDTSQPDGAPRKLMDSQRLYSLGWRPEVDLIEGLTKTYAFFRQASGIPNS